MMLAPVVAAAMIRVIWQDLAAARA